MSDSIHMLLWVSQVRCEKSLPGNIIIKLLDYASCKSTRPSHTGHASNTSKTGMFWTSIGHVLDDIRAHTGTYGHIRAHTGIQYSDRHTVQWQAYRTVTCRVLPCMPNTAVYAEYCWIPLNTAEYCWIPLNTAEFHWILLIYAWITADLCLNYSWFDARLSYY